MVHERYNLVRNAHICFNAINQNLSAKMISLNLPLKCIKLTLENKNNHPHVKFSDFAGSKITLRKGVYLLLQ